MRRRKHCSMLGFGFATTNCILRTFTYKASVCSITRTMATCSQSDPVDQKFDYFLVLDFEATCDNTKRIYPQEIIEFPCLKVNAKTGNIESEFHHYVQPKVHKELTVFCTELTGIIQDMVDGQPHFEEVLQKFDAWMKKENLVDGGKTSAFVTCGDWDLKTMLPNQCRYFNIHPPNYFSQWINIKKGFAELTGVFPKGMMPMLSMLNLKHVGRHHSGIDDCRNIAAILKEMMKKHYVPNITSLPLTNTSYQ